MQQSQRYQLPDGRIVEPNPGGGYRVVPSPSAGPVGIPLAPPDPRLQYQTQREELGVRGDQVGIQRDQAAIPQVQAQTDKIRAEIPSVNLPTGMERGPDGRAKGIPYAPFGPPEAGQRWNHDGTALEPIPNFQRAAPASALTAEQRNKLVAQRNALGLLNTRVDEIESLYGRDWQGLNLRDVVENTPLRHVLPKGMRSSAVELEGAAGTLMGDLKEAMGLTGGEGNTAVEVELRYGPWLPRPGDPDHVFEAKMKRLRELLANQQDGVAAQLGEPAPDQAPTATDQNVGSNEWGQRQSDNQAAVRNKVDPVRRGHAERLGMMLARPGRYSDAQVRAYLGEHFPEQKGPEIEAAIRGRHDPQSEYGRYIRQNPGKPLIMDPGWYTRQEERGPVAQAIGAALDTGPGAMAVQHVNSALAGTLPDLADAVGIADDMDVRAGLEGARSANPKWSLAGDLTGAATAFGTGGSAMRGANALQNAPVTRMVLGDTLYGGTYGAASNPDDRLYGAATGATLQAGGGLGGRAAVRGLGSTMTGVRDPAVRRLLEADVPLSVGQTVGQSGPLGRFYHGIENATTAIPGLRELVRGRQIDARTAVNRNAWDESLAPIGQDIGGRVGEPASEAADQLRSAAYDRVFNGRTFAMDPLADAGLAARSAAAVDVPSHGEAIQRLIDNQVRAHLDAGDIQGAHRLVRDHRAHYAALPEGNLAAQELGRVQDEIEGLIARSYPDAMTDLNNANRTYRLSSVMQRATAQGMNNPGAPGLASPAQIGQAARQNSNAYGRPGEASSTRRPFYQSQRDAQTVLPENLPDSGTITRGLVGASLIGGGGLAEHFETPGAAEGATGLGLLALLNTRGGTALARSLLTSRPQGMVDAGNRLTRQNFTVPLGLPSGRLVPQLNYTGPGLGGILAGTLANSMIGEQNYLRPSY